MRIAVIGGGPVGLVSGSALANVGHDVTVVDVDRGRSDKISRGEAPFHEPGLPELLRRVVDGKRLHATHDAGSAVREAAVVLICVGTPSGDHGADLTALRAASADVGRGLAGRPDPVVVVVKSTVPPGTTLGVVAPIVRAESGLPPALLSFGMNPEFLREGVAVDDMLHPDRIVLGIDDPSARPVLESMYQPFGAPLVFTTPSGAEMAKYASNALLATLISYANEIAQFCEDAAGIDALEVLRAVHLDRRFRPPASRPLEPSTITSYLLPGLGYGGSCFPKDTAALAAWARGRGLEAPILDAVRSVNAWRPQRVLSLLRSRIDLQGARVALLGLAFKPDTDDLRESRSLDFARLLAAEGADVHACDPVAGSMAGDLLRGVATISPDAESALNGADAAVLATAWPVYVALDPVRVGRLMRRPLVLDARRALDPRAWSAHCEYVPIGVKA
jgi:UDPglucose 6-dehydrogenase/GDP-mannose 6-dehydrogenase